MKEGLGTILRNSIALRVWISMTILSLLLLWFGGGTFLDGLKLLVGVLAIGNEGEGSLRFLFWRVVRSFFIMGLAVMGGLCASFALSLVASFMGTFFSRLARALGRLLGYMPIMSVCLLVIYACIKQWELPIESMLPFETKSFSETWFNKLGRDAWGWLLPSLLLSLPVLGKGLEHFGENFVSLSKQPLMLGLKARGVTRTDRVFVHTFALSAEKMRDLVVSLPPLVMVSTIIVEELLRYKGWGEFGAKALRAGDAPRLAAFFYGGAFMVAIWLGLLEWLERRYPMPSQETLHREDRDSSNMVWGILASLLGAAGLATIWFWDHLFPANSGFFAQVSLMLEAELLHAIYGAFCCTVWGVILTLVFFLTPRAWSEALGEFLRVGRLIPLFLIGICFLWVTGLQRPLGTWLLSFFMSVPAGYALSKVVDQYKGSLRYLSSYGVGAKSLPLFAKVIWPAVLPGVVKLFFHALSTWLIWQCFISYLGKPHQLSALLESSSVGGLIYEQSEVIFDHYINLLPPSLMITTLCFTALYLGECLSEACRTAQPNSRDGRQKTF